MNRWSVWANIVVNAVLASEKFLVVNNMALFRSFVSMKKANMELCN